MSLNNRLALGIGLAFALLLGPANAHATSYTVDATILMDDLLGHVLNIVPVFDDTGAPTCSSGDCSGPDFLIFEVSVVSGGFQEIFASVLPGAGPLGLGYLAGAGTTPSVTSVVIGGGGRFDFDTPNLTGQSVRLFTSYLSLSTALTTSFSATPVGDLPFNRVGGIIPIPEPSTATLCALGLAIFGVAGRYRRRPA